MSPKKITLISGLVFTGVVAIIGSYFLINSSGTAKIVDGGKDNKVISSDKAVNSEVISNDKISNSSLIIELIGNVIDSSDDQNSAIILNEEPKNNPNSSVSVDEEKIEINKSSPTNPENLISSDIISSIVTKVDIAESLIINKAESLIINKDEPLISQEYVSTKFLKIFLDYFVYFRNQFLNYFPYFS